ncbi:MAG TPA: acetyl-CoA carboxylase biotin carboxyl carrier protein [Flavilitoribacter sp.]|nr:acetyl-CoA carboxylase biotin carboxyl carrier protein [Flavilitoribacter sp.]
MTFKDIQELLRLINRLELSEFKMKDGEFELSVRTKHFEKSKGQIAAPVVTAAAPVMSVPQVQAAVPPPAPAPAKQAAAPQAPAKEDSDESRYIPVKSPMVGTFYRSSGPEKPAYVKVGDDIQKGDVVCIIEAMKLFNEIESEISGKVAKIMVEDAQPVEYDQVLFLVDPQG